MPIRFRSFERIEGRGDAGFWATLGMPRDPFREWRESYARYGTDLAFKPDKGSRFWSAVQPVCASPRVVRTRLSPGLVFRDRRMVNDGNDNINLAVSFESDLNLHQAGRDVCLGRHEATIMLADEPGTAATRREFNVLEISMSRTDWRARGANPGDALLKAVDRRSESLRLLTSYIAALAKAGQPTATDTLETVARHIVDLAVLVATRPSVSESDLESVAAARRAAVLEQIARRFQEPDLTGGSVAQTLGISQRYLQWLLQETGKSFTEHVTELRLTRAFTLLSSTDRRRLISEIAFEAGFSDLAHFHRLFRARFGDTPGAVAGSAKAPRAN